MIKTVALTSNRWAAVFYVQNLFPDGGA